MPKDKTKPKLKVRIPYTDSRRDPNYENARTNSVIEQQRLVNEFQTSLDYGPQHGTTIKQLEDYLPIITEHAKKEYARMRKDMKRDIVAKKVGMLSKILPTLPMELIYDIAEKSIPEKYVDSEIKKAYY